MRRRKADRETRPASTPPTARGATATRPAPEPRNAMLRLQRVVGNRAVQRKIEALRGPDDGGSDGTDIVDSRVDLVRVETVEGKPSLKDRKVTYKEEKSSAVSGFGATESKLTIEYAVDDATGEVRIGAIRPEYIVTIYTPYVSSGEFVHKFGPIVESLWEVHGGDMMAFSKSSEVRNFPYEPQTMRHEQMHVSSRQLALRDIVPGYLAYMRDNGFLKAGVSRFTEQTHFYLKTAWDERVEQVISHEQIYYLDTVNMVEEFRQRMSEEETEPEAQESGGWADLLSKLR